VNRRTLDVAHLPTAAFGSRDPLWWGIVLLMAIEGTMFLLLIGSLYYLRADASSWPPSDVPLLVRSLAAADLVLLLASAAPIHFANVAAERGDLRRMRVALAAAIAVAIANLVVRGVMADRIPFRWDTHAYGSVFWMFFFLHTIHVTTNVVEGGVMLATLFKRPLEEKALVDVHATGIYWYFVVVSWIPCYAALFLDPALARL
jgi:cytochrome c oxidase subunit III